jgi:hypothetical protein
VIPQEDWKWFGNAGHFICGMDCRFHLCTLIGDILVSTVGEYLPDSGSWDIYAEQKGVTLKGRGDARRADFLNRVGYVTIGLERLYETMAFRVSGGTCECGCGLPNITGSEIAFDGYNDAGAATKGHHAICLLASNGRIEETEYDTAQEDES